MLENYENEENLIKIKQIALKINKRLNNVKVTEVTDPFKKEKKPIEVKTNEAKVSSLTTISTYGVPLDSIKAHNVLNLLSFSEVIGKLVKLSINEDNADQRLRMKNIFLFLMKSDVNERILKTTGAGKKINLLKKQSNHIEIKSLAKRLIDKWKKSIEMMKQTKENVGLPKSNDKFARVKASDVSTKTIKPIKQVTKSVVKRKREEMSDEMWEKRFRERARESYETVQFEEKYSKQIGKDEDKKCSSENV